MILVCSFQCDWPGCHNQATYSWQEFTHSGWKCLVHYLIHLCPEHAHYSEDDLIHQLIQKGKEHACQPT